MFGLYIGSDLPKDEYGVIIINDGSKDRSPNIAQEYCTKYKNFKYLSQANQVQIVRKSILIENNLRLIPEITSQDTELSHRIYACATDVYTFDYVTYLYLHNSLSASQSKEIKKVLRRDISNITISKSFRSFSETIKDKDSELSSFFHNQSKNILLGLVLSMINKQKEHQGTGINQKVLEEMKKQGVYPLHRKFDTFKKEITVRFLNYEYLLRKLI